METDSTNACPDRQRTLDATYASIEDAQSTFDDACNSTPSEQTQENQQMVDAIRGC